MKSIKELNLRSFYSCTEGTKIAESQLDMHGPVHYYGIHVPHTITTDNGVS